ncbi:hypothetical protein ACLOJK_039938 [Asimina triloba]
MSAPPRVISKVHLAGAAIEPIFPAEGNNANDQRNAALSLDLSRLSSLKATRTRCLEPSKPQVIDDELISVVELMDIPSSAASSSSSSAVSVKRDPLTTLRDNLIVTLHDANGNEISRTDVPTMSVVQKGVWDDLFSFHGGGLVRMKLEFMLSQEERKRIQDMESADPAKATSASEKLNQFSFLDTIQSEQPLQSSSDSKGHQQAEMAPKFDIFLTINELGTLSTDSLSREVHKDGQHSSQIRAFHFTESNSNSSEENQSSDTSSIITSITQKPILSQESLDSLLRYYVSPPSLVSTGSSNSVPHTPGGDATYKTEMKSLTTRSPSSVREMISAFETKRPVTNRGRAPHMSPLDRSQITISKMRSSSQDTLVEETSWLCVSTGGLEESIIKNPKVDESFYAKNQEHKMHSNLATQAKAPAHDAKPVDPGSKLKFKILNVRSHQDFDVLIDEITLDQSSNPQQSKSNSTRRKDPEGSKSGPFKLLGEEHKTTKGMDADKDMVESNLCLALYGGGRKPCREDPNSPTLFGALRVKQETVVECLFDSPWNWIFQETRYLCITTASKQLRYAIEGYCVTKRQPPAVNLSTTEEEKMASHTFRKSSPADSPHVSISPQALIAQEKIRTKKYKHFSSLIVQLRSKSELEAPSFNRRHTAIADADVFNIAVC